MKKIVITGGVGSGKSKVLSILKEKCNCKVVRADDVAKELMKPGKQCYLDIIDTFPEYDLLEDEGGPFDKTKLSQLVFANPGARAKINAIVHPAVKEYILEDVKSEEETGQYDYYFLETALAIEEKYNELFDETWYIYTDIEERKRRLINDRGYSSKKVDEIFKSQLSDEEFRRFATRVIDNNGTSEELLHKIDILFPVSENRFRWTSVF